jgi:hypothetical protein
MDGWIKCNYQAYYWFCIIRTPIVEQTGCREIQACGDVCSSPPTLCYICISLLLQKEKSSECKLFTIIKLENQVFVKRDMCMCETRLTWLGRQLTSSSSNIFGNYIATKSCSLSVADSSSLIYCSFTMRS